MESNVKNKIEIPNFLFKMFDPQGVPKKVTFRMLLEPSCTRAAPSPLWKVANNQNVKSVSYMWDSIAKEKKWGKKMSGN